MASRVDEAMEAYCAGQLDRAVELVSDLAERGDGDAQTMLAVAYWDLGRFEDAERWYLTASDAGHGGASHNLGVMYAVGWPGHPPDLEKFRFYLQRAYDTGFEHRVASDPLWWKHWGQQRCGR